MADINSGLGWSAAQWEKVSNAVTEAFGKASVAGAFLPCYGPLPESAEYVRDEKFAETGARVKVEDDRTLKLFNLTVQVELSSEQVAEDALSSALLAFRRAANTLAQVEDQLVFNGFQPVAAENARDAAKNLRETAEKARDIAKKASDDAKGARDEAVKELGKAPEPLGQARAQAFDDLARKLQGAEKKHEEAQRELEAKEREVRDTKKAHEKAERTSIVVAHPDTLQGLAEIDLTAARTSVATLRAQKKDVGEILVSAVVKAIADLEDASHPGPFACVLGSNVFEEAQRPVAKSMVLPADRITPLLNGPLLRSGQMDKDTGIVVSLAGGDIDIVVATPPKVQFLQVTDSAKYLFRVYEKFILRIKDQTAVQPLALA